MGQLNAAKGRLRVRLPGFLMSPLQQLAQSQLAIQLEVSSPRSAMLGAECRFIVLTDSLSTNSASRV